jgi:general secretion pathway protein K
MKTGLAISPFAAAAPRGRARPARRGSVIVVVLVTLLLASLMLMKFIENSAVELTLATRQADKARLRADAYAALETAIAVVAEVKALDETLHAPAQGWGDPYAYLGETPREGLSVEFTFTDESGKLSLPTLTFDEMVELAQVLGLGEHDARRFSDGLFAWTRADHSPQEMEAEASRYERDTIPHEPPKRSLRSWDELRAVRVARNYVYDEDGALTPFGQALRDNLSLYRYNGANINALAPMIGVLRGWDPAQTNSIVNYHAGRTARPAGAPPWFRGADDVRALLGANADTQGIDATVKLLRVEVSVREGQASMRLGALLALDSSVALPAVAAGAGTAPEASPGETPADGAGTGAGQGAGRRGQGGARGAGGAARETGGGGATSEERLNYPFRVLEVVENSGPAPVVPADDESA